MRERQEIHCHACGKFVQFDIDLSLNGNHVLSCPNCGHEHCRVVKDGVITGERWATRNGPTFQVTYVAATSASTLVNYMSVTTSNTTGGIFLYDAWMNAGTTS